MKYLVCILFLFSACKPSNPVNPRKAAIIQQMIYDIRYLHFDMRIPSGHPEKIEEIIFSGWEKSVITFKREYFYKDDRLVKVVDNESGENETYVLKYDKEGRCIFIEQQTVHGQAYRDSIKYHDNEVIRRHFISGKTEEKFRYLETSDSLIITTPENGYQTCTFRESNDTMYVKKIGSVNDTVYTEAYDNNNRKMSVTYMNKGITDHIIYYTYDEYGNELSSLDVGVDNNTDPGAAVVAMRATQGYRSKYEYDSQKNWTLKQKQDPSSYFKETITRKITYAK